MSRISKSFIAYTVLLCMFTVYVLLDTFVITRVYGDQTSSAGSGTSVMTEEEEDALEASGSTANTANAATAEGSAASSEAVSTGNSYKDENISVTVSEYRENDTDIYVADVQLSSPEYLQTALAQGVYGRNVKEETSTIAENNNAILAVNGDYYGAREAGYVIKNGELLRNTSAGREDLVIYEDGSWKIVSEDEVSAEELLADGAVQTMSFGPGLIENGEISVGVNEEVKQSMSSNPRTAIGIIDDCHYVFVVSDGRTDESAGLSLYQLAEFMKGLGCDTAYNLDGGGSSTMYFNGEVINNPTGGKAGHGEGSERSVSDIIYIGY
ncbi:MAG: phosphodiester glycosidase family protein [Mogibacterium sp.]|nr:phosphodiester glycosidase family protein [Mogibacterium sp.]